MNEAKRRWAIVGAGNGGQAFAAYLTQKGLEVTLTDTADAALSNVTALGRNPLISLEGEGTGEPTEISLCTLDMAEAVAGAEVILVTVPSPFHRLAARKLAPYLEDGQTVILNPIAPLGPIEFRNELEHVEAFQKKAPHITIAGTSTLLFACRAQVPGKVHVSGHKQEVLIAAYPATENDRVETLTKPYIPEFRFVKNILDVSFDNLNFEFHPGPTLLFAAMIQMLEKKNEGREEAEKEKFEYYHNFSDCQIRLIHAMDKERMALCRAYGVDADEADAAFGKMYGLNGSLADMLSTASCYNGIYAPGSLKGCRYLTEDVPYALRAIQSLAKIARIETPVIDAVVSLAYVVSPDTLDEGRTLENLGFDSGTTVQDVLDLCNGK